MKKILSVTLIMALVISFVGTVAPEEKTPVIIGFKDKPDADLVKERGGDIKWQYTIINAIAAKMPKNKIEELRKNPKIDYIELDREVYALVKPAPSQPPESLPWGIDRVDAELSWGISTGNGIKIAVIDSGIDYKHPDLNENVKGGVTFVAGTKDYKDDNGHGTHVAGIIAAENNDIGVVGVAPSAWLYGVKVLNKVGSGWVSDLIEGIDWSVNNEMQVITMSLGLGADVQPLQDAVDNAYNKGSILVAAAGNDYGGPISYPAKYESVIAVTATDSNNNLASFSNIGPEAELAAPGVKIYSTYKGGTYATLSGTSMSAPHVTGTVALLLTTTISTAYDLDNDHNWDPLEVRNRLHDTATDLGTLEWDQYYGYGLVNASKAVSP